MHFSALRGINRTAQDNKLLLMAVLVHPVDCINSYQILKAQHCCLSLNVWFNPLLPPDPAPTSFQSFHPLYRPNLVNQTYFLFGRGKGKKVSLVHETTIDPICDITINEQITGHFTSLSIPLDILANWLYVFSWCRISYAAYNCIYYNA